MARTSNTHPTNAPRAAAPRAAHDSLFERFATRLTAWVGGNLAFAIACTIVVVWIAT